MKIAYVTSVKRSFAAFGRRTFFGLLCGALAGAVGIALFWGIEWLQHLRLQQPWLLYLLPLLGVVIVALYRGARIKQDHGTNGIIQAARGEREIPLRQGALIFFGTTLSHLGGGSTGREGAAVQIGGSIGDWLSRLFRADQKDRRILVMCGISSAFSAAFGTPLTAILFPLEIATAGRLSISAFWPCAIASAIGYAVRLATHAHAEVLTLPAVAGWDWLTLLKVLSVAAFCALVSRLFCLVMTYAGKGMDKIPFMKNPYLRVAVGGVLIILLTAAVGNRDYNGAGMSVIVRTVEEGEVVWYAFLLKILFTAVTLKSGFKGGEVVPTLFIGATAGCAFASLIGLSPSLGAAVGLVALFVGVTDCPLSTLLLGFELFAGKMGWYLLPAVAFGWFFSGKDTLYKRLPSPLCRYRLK